MLLTSRCQSLPTFDGSDNAGREIQNSNLVLVVSGYIRSELAQDFSTTPQMRPTVGEKNVQ